MKRHTVVVLDPGHFHAALPFKSPNPRIGDDIYVYAPAGPELERFLSMIDSFNRRDIAPTAWNLHVYRGSDSLQRLIAEKRGDVAVLAGTNHDKSRKIAAMAAAGINVLADKPLVIDGNGLSELNDALSSAAVVADMMTSRHDSSFILLRELADNMEIFGGFDAAAIDTISIDSVHCLAKEVAGTRLIRPPWYFDVKQQGIGIVDVSTHYVDLIIKLLAKPEQHLQLELEAASLWPTMVPSTVFNSVTGTTAWPEYLLDTVENDILKLNANGEIRLRCQNIPVSIRIEWRLCSAPGIVEGINFCCRGNKATLAILRQPGGTSSVFIYPNLGTPRAEFGAALLRWQSSRTGIEFKERNDAWEVVVASTLKTTHEEQFAIMMDNFLDRIERGALADNEKTALSAKYHLLTNAANTVKPKQL